MKTISLQIILIFLIMGTAFSQVETFESETDGATSFNVGVFNFTATGDFLVEVHANWGCGQSNAFLGTGIGNGGSSGSFGSIKVTNPNGVFKVSTLSPWCAFVSIDDGLNPTPGDIKFTGTLFTGGTIEDTFHVVNMDNAGYGEIAFSTEKWDDKWLTELGATMVNSLNYLALDNIFFDSIDIIISVSNIQEEAIKIFPNPAAEDIDIIGIDNFDVKIIDAFGRIVKQQSVFHQKIDVSDLVDGMYYVSINTDNQQITKRLIKQ